ncbi:MAG TPA: cytochrome P460 family protein [Rhodanobacteraceae bacterium]|nr:cytochrome P460 family protein [Rhodanobacteraceae bacterium]
MHAALKYLSVVGGCSVLAVAVAAGSGFVTGDSKYSVKVPGGLSFSEVKGYEKWEPIAISHNGEHLALILGNPTMIAAYKSGVPGNGKPFPDGSKMVKAHWEAKKSETEPGNPYVPGGLHDIDVMVRDSKRFADSGNWGYGYFKYEAAGDKFVPATTADSPPQANDAKCGFACHTVVKTRDYVFTDFARR